ncbi:MAG TPA: hypothetical protein VGI39_36385, partial [Polyangiaceae bacterium]
MRLFFAAFACALLVGCSTSGTPSSPGRGSITANTACTDSLLGPAGGTLAHPAGATLTVPPGALATSVRLTLCGVAPASASALQGLALAQGFEAGPNGTTFLKPVELALPFDATRLPAGMSTANVQVRAAPGGSNQFDWVQASVDLASG